MTNHEKLSQITGKEEPIHEEAARMLHDKRSYANYIMQSKVAD